MNEDRRLLGRDPVVWELLGALGVKIEGELVQRVEIVADCREPVKITVHRLATEGGVRTAKVVVDEHHLVALGPRFRRARRWLRRHVLRLPA